MLPKRLLQILVLKAKELLYRIKARLRNKNKDFTIIASNCWGTSVYEDLGVKYNSPTIGLFFMAPCYIKFIYNLRYYTSIPLSFTEKSRYFGEDRSYPIGLIDDIEIHFFHYKDKAEAKVKWERRIKRINYSNLFFAFTDKSLCSVREIELFDKFVADNKVFFSAKNYSGISSLVWLKDYKDDDTIGDIYTQRHICRKYFDVIGWLNRY